MGSEMCIRDSYTFAGLLLLLVGYWVFFQRHTFVGPKVTLAPPAPAAVQPGPGT